jgi:hypothetical protein
MMYKGMMGYFRVNPMPTSNIKYIMVDSLACLNKIVTYKRLTTRHVAMTGIHQYGHNVLADAYFDSYFGVSSNWVVRWAAVSDMVATFDDIAVTSNYVVASARVPDSSAAYLCFFPKPPLAYRTFLEANNNMLQKLPYSPNSNPVLLQSGRLDTFFVIYRGIAPAINVCQYNALQNIVTRCIPGSFLNWMHVKDVQGSYGNDKINILVNVTSKLDPVGTYRIYNIPSGKMASGGTVYARSYPAGTLLFSLGGNNSDNQDAAGLYQSGEMGIFRSVDNGTGNCAGSLSTPLNLLSAPTYDPIFKSLDRGISDEMVRFMPVTVSTYTVSTVCQ